MPDLGDNVKKFLEDSDFHITSDRKAEGTRTITALGKIKMGLERLTTYGLFLAEVPGPRGDNVVKSLKKDSFMNDYASTYNAYPAKVVLESENLRVIVENRA